MRLKEIVPELSEMLFRSLLCSPRLCPGGIPYEQRPALEEEIRNTIHMYFKEYGFSSISLLVHQAPVEDPAPAA